MTYEPTRSNVVATTHNATPVTTFAVVEMPLEGIGEGVALTPLTVGEVAVTVVVSEEEAVGL